VLFPFFLDYRFQGVHMQKAVVLSVALAAAAISTPAYSYQAACQPTSEAEIASLFDRWNASLQSGQPHKVVDNYTSNSVLLPTVSNKVRLTPEEKEDYFHHFMEKKPVGKIDMRKISIDCNTAIDTGLYTFKFGDGSQVKARYTYTYKWDNGSKKWLITSHHSSGMPEKN